MKTHPLPQATTAASMQTVLDQLAGERGLCRSRARDLRSAVISYAKVRGQPPAGLPLDLADVRRTLDKAVPDQSQVTAKRWQNLRSDLATAIHASGLRPMLKTTHLTLDEAWGRLLERADPQIRQGLSRFARWASWRRIAPQAIDDSTIERFVAELDAATLVRNLRYIGGNVGKCWNALAALQPGAGLRPVAMAGTKRALKRVRWQELPACLRDDVERYLRWAEMPDPLADDARARGLRPRTLRLHRDHIHSAITAAAATGIALDCMTSLASLVEKETFRTLLRQRWQNDGRKLSAYTHGVAITLITVASGWVKLPAEAVAGLNVLLRKLGSLPRGLTEKNEATLRTLDDPRVMTDLIHLPDKLWREAREKLATSRYAFTLLQTALAIDILINVPFRMQNLSALNFNSHLHLPQGRRKPALIRFRSDDVKNAVNLVYEIPAALAERLQVYRNEIALAVTGTRPDAVFITRTGRPRGHQAIRTAIAKMTLRYLGVRITPHQFRHITAKIILDANPYAHELVRQMLGHTSEKTAKQFYGASDTLRAARAHAELILKLRESRLGRQPRRSRLKAQED